MELILIIVILVLLFGGGFRAAGEVFGRHLLFRALRHFAFAGTLGRAARYTPTGKVTGDKELQTEGKFDKAKGAAHNVVGDVKDAVRKDKE
jgi:CsbD-like